MKAWICTALLAVVLATAVGIAPGTAVAAPHPAPPRRILIVSLPRITWADIVRVHPKNLDRLLARSAVASMSIRTIGTRTSPGEGYASVGAGNRAGALDADSGAALGPQEPYEDGVAAATYTRRTGLKTAGNQVLQLNVASILATNNRYLYGAIPGALGSALAAGGWQRAVIGNADFGTEGVDASLNPDGTAVTPGGGAPGGTSADGSLATASTPQQFSSLNRSVALGLMDQQGRVPGGDVSRDLLKRDSASPFGVRMDTKVVQSRFRHAWQDKAVVLLEMSDLERADRYGLLSTVDQAPSMFDRALRQADRLLGQVLKQVDLSRDLVIVMSPAAPRQGEEPTPFALAGRGVRKGLAVSGTTRRAGYVTLPDVAPTILDQVGLDQPASMNGALIADTGKGGTGKARNERFRELNEITKFRDRATGPVSVLFVVFQVLGYAFAALSLTGRRQRLRPAACFVALMTLAFPSLVFLSGLVRYDWLGLPGYIAVLFAGSALLAFVAQQAGFRLLRREDLRAALVPPMLLVGLVYAVLVVDIVTGGRLQLNTVFGYSPVVAGRFAGFGNLAFALVAMAAVVLATGVWALARIGEGTGGRNSRVGLAFVLGIFLLTIVVDGYPSFGSDIGGVLALVPAAAVVITLLSGRSINLRKVLVIGGGTALVLGTFAAIDMARPPQDRTHLGRLVATIGGGGGGGLGNVLGRKLQSNLHILTSSTFTWIIPAAFLFLAFLVWRRRGFIHTLMEGVPGMRALLWGAITVGAIGFALNDSGVAVPAMMFPVLLPYLMHMVVQPDAGPDAPEPKWLVTLLERLERRPDDEERVPEPVAP
ncbi:MAG: Flagellar basal body rod protein [Acidimicrobiales bacterium]|nr:Flagellar basal body rod protein [Acidimicrobiales bacterium]